MRKFDAYRKDDPGDNGLNNASILTFSKDVVDALIKELTQNSIDAKEDGQEKVCVKINMFELGTEEIQELDSLRLILEEMSSYWAVKNQTDFVKFFNNGRDLIQGGKMNVFAFEDFNTKGLEGDRTKGSFKNLIYDEGVSDNKPDNALGGFGIGKNSFFALTALQTVIYSSFHENRGHMFMGVTKLAEYVDENDVRKNNRVYYGDWEGGEVVHVTEPDLIPDLFRRSENGLSSFALGVQSEPEWKKLVIKALIKNYWFLFEEDKILAEVGEILLNKENYSEYASDVFEGEDSILAFIHTFNDPQYTFEYDVHAIGGIKILLCEQPEDSSFDYPDSIVFIRDGMMIKEYTLGVRNLPNRVAGIIYCDNSEGNKILSKMEPPAHDNFESFYLPKKHPTLTEEDGKKIIKQIESYRRKAVLSLKETYNMPTKQVGFVDELLSGLSVSTGDGGSTGNNSKSVEESFSVAKQEGDIELELSSSTSNVISTLEESEETEEVVGGKQREGKGGGGSRDDTVKGNGDKGKGSKKRSRNNETISKAKFYFSHEDSGHNHYVLIVYSEKDLKNVSLKFTQHGDSPTKAVSTKLIRATNGIENFKVIKQESYFELTGLNLKANIRNKFDVVFEEDYKSAFKVLK
jgi:hypothetical protein